MIKKVRGITRRLVKSYSKGLISYPRVSNNYSPNPNYFQSPHVGFDVFDTYSSSLNKKDYPLNKKTAILELTNVEILTPATIENVFEVIDIYFDDNLKIKQEMKSDLYKLLDNFERYLESKNKNINELCKDGQISDSLGQVNIYRIELSPSAKSDEEQKYTTKSKKEKAANFTKKEKHFKASCLGDIPILYTERKKKKTPYRAMPLENEYHNSSEIATKQYEFEREGHVKNID